MISFFLSFGIGLFSKLTDDIIDEKYFKNKKLAIIPAILYGLIGGYLLSINEVTFTFGLIVILGVLLGGKIDHEHQIALAILFLTISFFGFPKIIFPILLLLTIASFLDEFLAELGKKIKQKKDTIIGKFLRMRLFLEIILLVTSIITNNFEYFFLILSYDLGYHLTHFIIEKVKK